MPGKLLMVGAIIGLAGLALSGCTTEGGYYNGYYSPAYGGYAYNSYYDGYNGYYGDGSYYGRNYRHHWHRQGRPIYIPGSPASPAYVRGRPTYSPGRPPFNPGRPAYARPAPRIGQGAIVQAIPASPISVPAPIQPASPARADDSGPVHAAPRIGQGVIVPGAE